MKRLLFVLSIFVILISLSSCKEPKTTAGTPKLAGIEFSKYDAFAVMREPDGSRGLFDGVSGGVNRLFGLADNVLEKIIITDDKGLEWACNRVGRLGENSILLVLSCAVQDGMGFKNYIVDRLHNKVIDLSFLMDGKHTDIRDYGVQATASGLFAKRSNAVVSIDVESKTMTQLTNPKTDIINAFWENDDGDMLALTETNYGTLKAFPGNGEVPVSVTDVTGVTYDLVASLGYYGLRDRNPIYFIANSKSGLILCLRENLLCRLSAAGLSFEKLTKEAGGGIDYRSGICLSDKTETGYGEKVIYYSGSYGYVTIHDLSSGEHVVTRYDAPTDLPKAAYWNGHLIYSTPSGMLCSLDLEKQTTEMLVENSLADWKMTTGGVIYTRYLSASENETYLFNLATKEEEKLSSSGVEVVSIASFVE